MTSQHSSPTGNESALPCSFAANHGDDMVRLYEHCRADAHTNDNHSHVLYKPAESLLTMPSTGTAPKVLKGANE